MHGGRQQAEPLADLHAAVVCNLHSTHHVVMLRHACPASRVHTARHQPDIISRAVQGPTNVEMLHVIAALLPSGRKVPTAFTSTGTRTPTLSVGWSGTEASAPATAATAASAVLSFGMIGALCCTVTPAMLSGPVMPPPSAILLPPSLAAALFLDRGVGRETVGTMTIRGAGDGDAASCSSGAGLSWSATGCRGCGLAAAGCCVEAEGSCCSTREACTCFASVCKCPSKRISCCTSSTTRQQCAITHRRWLQTPGSDVYQQY